MADTPISGLTDGGAIQTTDQVPVTRGTANFRTLVGALAPLDNVPTARIDDAAVTTVKILDSNVTLAKIQNIASDRILGRVLPGAGNVEELTAALTKTLLAYLAGEIAYTPSGDLIATDVQGAIDELEAAKSNIRRTIRSSGLALVPHLLTDDGNIVLLTSASANTFRIESNAIVPSQIETQIDLMQRGAGVTTVLAGAGVTLNDVAGGSGDILDQFGSVTLLKLGTNDWLMTGNHDPVA